MTLNQPSFNVGSPLYTYGKADLRFALTLRFFCKIVIKFLKTNVKRWICIYVTFMSCL